MANDWQQFGKPSGLMGRMLARGMNRGHAPFTRWCLSYLDGPVSAALDIGCGGGGAIRHLLKTYPQAQVDGLDYSEDCVAVARKTNYKERKRCDIKQGTAEANPYPDASLDLVTAFETVYFWSDLPRAFGEIHRVLQEQGRFLLGCELLPSPTSLKYQEKIPGMKIYDPQELVTYLEKAGFTKVDLFQGKKESFCLLATK
ncbi:class I SAM-dependent methyltransferase [Streptococcus oricebi]|uniref:Class I SAM-dependent methyltransferase n=1 Tax=Streptococcus oricebi TaxID=1547447 RepID=A0ABS5B5C4_9STRE|nr:class I SAM-dependent methyltransferase [Streptococcus oricebi]MBP2624025.1 class I SAM-dependent methyltransferase [Streptococcus oricebi]